MPLWDRSTMRVFAFVRDQLDDAETSRPAGIRAVARIDVLSHPALGNGMGRLMVARHEIGAQGHQSRPFSGQRLENAIWNPSPPDVLVVASSGECDAVPDLIRRGLPWIYVLTAWRRLQPIVATNMLQACWDRGFDIVVPGEEQGRPEREALFVAAALQRLLQVASPGELIALSREEARNDC